MATLQNIRNRGVLLAIVVGVALLAFIIGDFLNSGSTLFQQSKQNVAEINGEKLNIQDYQQSIEQMTAVYKIESGRTDFNENEHAQIRMQVWENLINERILGAEAALMGLTVSQEELRDRLIGNNIHPMIKQRAAFVDPKTGQFSQSTLLQFYDNVFDGDASAESREQLHEAKSYWLFWENAVKNSILQEKYFALIGKSIGVNSIEAKFNYDVRNMTGNVNYVFQPYYSIADSTIEITDSEIKARYEKQKKQYKQEPNRSIQYVSFNVEPLQEDFTEAQAWMDKVSEEFRTTNDVAGLINSESDIAYDERQSYSRQTVPEHLRDFAFNNSVGAMYGPVFQNNTHTMAKIMETGILESDSVKLRFIALASGSESKADSLIGALKNGADFAQAARTNSIDPQSAASGGEIGWVTRSVLPKEIVEPAFSRAVKDIFRVNNGQTVQVLQIMERTPARQRVKLAILERKVTPGNQSYSKLFNEAKQFAVAAADKKQFAELAEEKGYVVRPAVGLNKNSDNVDMIPQSRQVVRWAFENPKGKVSDVFDCDRNTYVVALVTEINDKEYKSIDNVKPQLKAEVMKHKKADLIKKQMADLLTQTHTLDGLADSLNTEVKVATDINFGSYYFGEGGMEPYIIGKASATPEGQISVPLQGEAGVYVILPQAKKADETPYDAKAEMTQLNSRIVQSLPYMLLQKLREHYEITDNRFNFY